MRMACFCLALACFAGAARAQNRADEARLTAALREVLVGSLPSPLYENNKHWGLQRKNLRGKMKNEGRWWKVRIEQRPDAAVSSVALDNLQKVGKGKSTFTVRLAVPTRIVLNRQTWLRGIRMYSGETRARVDLFLTIDCESESRLESPKGSLAPDFVFRLRILRSDFKYGKIVVEHTAGVGGDAARTLGDVMLGIAKQVKPSLERKLIARANAAILKAGDNKEVRVGLSRWLKDN